METRKFCNTDPFTSGMRNHEEVSRICAWCEHYKPCGDGLKNIYLELNATIQHSELQKWKWLYFSFQLVARVGFRGLAFNFAGDAEDCSEVQCIDTGDLHIQQPTTQDAYNSSFWECLPRVSILGGLSCVVETHQVPLATPSRPLRNPTCGFNNTLLHVVKCNRRLRETVRICDKTIVRDEHFEGKRTLRHWEDGLPIVHYTCSNIN